MKYANSRMNNLEKLVDGKVKADSEEALRIEETIGFVEKIKGFPPGTLSRTQKEAESKGFMSVWDELAHSFGMTLPEMSRVLREMEEKAE